MSRNRRKLQAFRQSAYYVSRAVWPAEMRRSVATNQAAQRRRLLIMRWSRADKQQRSCKHCGRRAQNINYVLHVNYHQHSHVAPTQHLFYAALSLALLAIGVSLTVVMLRHWALLFLLSVLWVLVTYLVLKTTRTKEHSLQRVLRACWSAFVTARNIPFVLSGHALAKASMQRFRARQFASAQTQEMPAQFPDTPMPSTPLIRVLETIDLSKSGVEHFLHESESELPAKLSNSEQKDASESDKGPSADPASASC